MWGHNTSSSRQPDAAPPSNTRSPWKSTSLSRGFTPLQQTPRSSINLSNTINSSVGPVRNLHADQNFRGRPENPYPTPNSSTHQRQSATVFQPMDDGNTRSSAFSPQGQRRISNDFARDGRPTTATTLKRDSGFLRDSYV